MKKTQYSLVPPLLLAAAILIGHAAAAAEGQTVQGRAYLSGGISVDERDEMQKRRSDFALRLATAARGSGTYLSGAEVKITDRAGIG